MFAKSLASSRVVMRWLICLMIAFVLSSCSLGIGPSICPSVCSAGMTGGPLIGSAVCVGCVIVTYKYRGSGEVYEKVASGIVVVINGYGKVSAGAIISPEGDILTSEEIADTNDIRVLFLADAKQQDAPRVSYVAEKVTVNRQHGLALLKLTQPPEKMTVLELASGGELQKNQTIYTIGHSDGGKESWVYSEGLVRDIIRDFKWTNPISSTTHQTDIAVQTQTPINPGDAGAFLFDDQGKLAGVFFFSDPADDRINYAISARVFADFISQ